MNQVLLFVVVIIALALSLTAFFGVLNVFFAQRIAKTRWIAESLPGRSFVVGLVNSAFFIILILAFMGLGNLLRSDVPRLVAVILLIPLGIGVIFGLAGLVELVGERLAPETGGLKRTAWGAVGLGLACGLPFAGWFGLLPFVAITGLGAFITGLFYREKAAPGEPEENPGID